MFEQIVTKAVGGAIEAAKVVDQSIVAFKADKNNTAKAVTVAQGLLSLAELLASLGINF